MQRNGYTFWSAVLLIRPRLLPSYLVRRQSSSETYGRPDSLRLPTVSLTTTHNPRRATMSNHQYDLFLDHCLDDAISQVDSLIERNGQLVLKYDDMIDRITRQLIEQRGDREA